MPFDGTQFEQGALALEKIDYVISALGTEDRWCKGHLRTSDGRRCIMGALNDANALQLLSQPILDAAGEVTGKSYHRIERFNDERSTSHKLVLAVLRRAREDILLGKTTRVRHVTVTQRVRAFYAALANLAT